MGFTWEWSYINYNKYSINPLLPPIGHAMYTHKPDQPYNNPDKAFSMAQVTYALLLEFNGIKKAGGKDLIALRDIFAFRLEKNERSNIWKWLIQEQFPHIKQVEYNNANISEWDLSVTIYQYLMVETFNFFGIILDNK
jgi:hypothetical protein